MSVFSQFQNMPGLYESLILAAAFVFVSLTIYLLGRYLTGRRGTRYSGSREDARLQRIAHDSPFNGEPEPGVLGVWAPALAAQFPESETEQKAFRQLLRQAGMYHPRAAETVYALRFVALAAPLLVAGLLAVLLDRMYSVRIMVAGVVVAGILVVVPRLYIVVRRRQHMQRIRDGLADVIDMLGMCLSGGLPLSAGLEQVAQRMTAYPDCANELLLLKRQAELGGIKRALEDFTLRVNLPEASQLASLLLRNTSLGTELVGSLALQADHLRLARRQAAMTEANKTPVKLIFPIMFCFAPAVLILLTAPAITQLQDFFTTSPAAGVIQRNVLSSQRQGLIPPEFAPTAPPDVGIPQPPGETPQPEGGSVPPVGL